MSFSTLKGMKDIYFKEIKKYDFIVNKAKETFSNYGFEKIITPILEETELFKRAVGDETDVVSKEMYTFIDKGDRSVTMRPEGTAGTLRAYLGAGLHKSNPNIKWFYYGPMFRYEAPQKGRYREFHQLGVESYGIRSSLYDAEIIAMAVKFLEKLNILDVRVEINSIANVETRIRYIKDLKEYLINNFENLSEDSKIRTHKNTLRVLDSKSEQDQKILENAPRLHDYFDEESKKYFEELKYYLDKLSIKYEVNEKLVRGLDYYCDTVFEIKTDKLGAQSTLIAGGRYDKLIKQLSGVDIPAIGFGAGIERIAMLLDDNLVDEKNKTVYIVYFEDTKDYLLEIVKKLREEGIKLEYEYQIKGFGAQMKRANKLNIDNVLILGENEKANNKVSLKNFVDSTQEEITLEEAIERIKNV